jgi:hypothetical protein
MKICTTSSLVGKICETLSCVALASSYGGLGLIMMGAGAVYLCLLGDKGQTVTLDLPAPPTIGGFGAVPPPDLLMGRTLQLSGRRIGLCHYWNMHRCYHWTALPPLDRSLLTRVHLALGYASCLGCTTMACPRKEGEGRRRGEGWDGEQ